MRLLVIKRATKKKHMKENTHIKKHTYSPFMNHQNARLIFALGEAAGKQFSVGISSSAGYLLDSSLCLRVGTLISVTRSQLFLIPKKTDNELIFQTSTACVANVSHHPAAKIFIRAPNLY